MGWNTPIIKNVAKAMVIPDKYILFYYLTVLQCYNCKFTKINLLTTRY